MIVVGSRYTLIHTHTHTHTQKMFMKPKTTPTQPPHAQL